ncbi:MAG: thiosulfate oxidation carrier protein SoxY [Gammaproteobacteria bacterium]|nr:thiosulfate oxidation carrier protein SoxY [Gammaproteobacteria bacterium]MBU1776173.1 thiosulfate oxidation carrier protein SoxY [Gammaproteobacteria bacterium]MBU1969916.1 thiosulfate oxidation carrier protein SoxY [Gammaproteobacteria bacterium]
MQLQGRNAVDIGRRHALKTGGGLGLVGVLAVLGLLPKSAWAGVDRKVFEATSLKDAFKAMGGLAPADSSQILLDVPGAAENGAMVTVTVESKLPRTEQISILVDKNPTALAENFTIPEGTEPFITTRIKMAQTATVVVLVKADGKFYKVGKEVKVTAGGC